MNRSAGGCIDSREWVCQQKGNVLGITLLGVGAAMFLNDAIVGTTLLSLGIIVLRSIQTSNELLTSSRPPLMKLPDGEKWSINHFNDAEVRELFGFDSVRELYRVYKAMKWPDYIRVGKGDPSKCYDVDGQQAFLFMLQRDHCGTKLSLMEFFYGYSYNSISEQALAAERWLVDNHLGRLQNLGFYRNRFELYAAAIRNRIRQNGHEIPPEGQRLIGVLDRCSVKIATPSGNWNFQHLFYNVKSKYHCLAYQSLTAPDGMHMHVWGPTAGKHNDRFLLAESGLNTALEDVQRLANGALPLAHLLYAAYTDRGYDSDTCIYAAHHGLYTTVMQLVHNAIMSSLRVAIEWSFARIRAMSKLLHLPWNMKMQGGAVDYHVKSAVLLANTRTTLRGSQASRYYGLTPPTLESYFQ